MKSLAHAALLSASEASCSWEQLRQCFQLRRDYHVLDEISEAATRHLVLSSEALAK